MPQDFLLFDEAYLSAATGAGEVERTNSDPIAAVSNTVVISAKLISSALSAGETLTIILEGTYDGKSWMNLHPTDRVHFTTGAPNFDVSPPITGISFAAVRLRATISGTTAKAIFSAWITFSEQ